MGALNFKGSATLRARGRAKARDTMSMEQLPLKFKAPIPDAPKLQFSMQETELAVFSVIQDCNES